MKILCEKNTLQTAAANVSRAAASKSPVPAMEGILFEARQGNLKLTAFDSKIGMYTFMEADIQQEGWYYRHGFWWICFEDFRTG